MERGWEEQDRVKDREIEGKRSRSLTGSMTDGVEGMEEWEEDKKNPEVR